MISTIRFLYKILFIGVLLSVSFIGQAWGESSINAIQLNESEEEFALQVSSDAPLTYTMYELYDPLRIILDISDTTLQEKLGLPLKLGQGPIARINGTVIKDQEFRVARLEIFLAADWKYTVDRQQHDILISFPKDQSEESAPDIMNAAETSLQDSPASRTVVEFEVKGDSENTLVYIQADGPLTDYTKSEQPKIGGMAPRLIIDLPGVEKSRDLQEKVFVNTVLAQIETLQREDGLQIIFDSGLASLFDYTLEPQPDGLLLKASLPAGMTLPPFMKPTEPAAESAPARIAPQTAAAAAALPPAPPAAAPTKTPTRYDNFTFAGYTRERITVDFFKVDIHNVFRLIGEISGLNIVIDQAVSGQVTLALQDVPWDFALDIILNMHDLQKEERFNTVIISPKAKAFKWPQKASEKISIKADGTIEKIEALTLTQRLETPKGELEAKKLMHQAYLLEKDQDFAGSLNLYEKAFAKWPDNKQLADKIASICLIRLGLNAKGVHYARTSLKIDPLDSNSALLAAIGFANMKKNDEAREYFELAVSVPDPLSEALASYAAFNENTGDYNKALSLLNRHEEIYVDTLETMIAKARIHDKLGQPDRAVEDYRAVLLSGYKLDPELQRYIKGRLSM